MGIIFIHNTSLLFKTNKLKLKFKDVTPLRIKLRQQKGIALV